MLKTACRHSCGMACLLVLTQRSRSKAVAAASVPFLAEEGSRESGLAPPPPSLPLLWTGLGRLQRADQAGASLPMVRPWVH